MTDSVAEGVALSPWFDIRKDGPPVRDGVYEGWTQLITSPMLTASTRGYKCFWEDGRWKSLPNADPKVLVISAPHQPDFWRGLLRLDEAGADV